MTAKKKIIVWGISNTHWIMHEILTRKGNYYFKAVIFHKYRKTTQNVITSSWLNLQIPFFSYCIYKKSIERLQKYDSKYCTRNFQLEYIWNKKWNLIRKKWKWKKWMPKLWVKVVFVKKWYFLKINSGI